MNDRWKLTSDLFQLGSNITQLYARRVMDAQNTFVSGIQKAFCNQAYLPVERMTDVRFTWPAYVTDSIQRWVLFCDTLRLRGNNFLAHEKAGKPPLLAFDYNVIVDGRTLPRPVNYALVQIIAPKGTKIDEGKRPFIIIDPRAGHGPGIGGFKQDSQVGVALKAGHPVYFVVFFERPEPAQTLLDVCEAEGQFVQAVIDRHPESPKPAILGNCQGGWATMMLAASRPEITGPVVINGSPMSYWSGSWSGDEGENPMRYSGGLLGGSWSALLLSDLGNGLYDGAHLVANFENLNPANSLWTKYYHLFANVDTEAPRFLEFEKWWGAYSLMNEAEIRWIVDNLFIGNRLARGEIRTAQHKFIDIKAIRSPIIVFSSAGDNITPPQQALNWIADAYSSTEEIIANGQVIVGLVHPDAGHLGIFVSGKVAKKEYTQIVEVLKHIESLRPGLYLMEITETKGTDGKPKYDIAFEERRLEDVRRINKFERKDEKPFEVVSEVSALVEKAYSLFVRPLVRPLVSDRVAEMGRLFNPLRWQRWGISDMNPLVWPLPVLAAAVKANRCAAPPENPFRRIEKATSEAIIATLNLYRDMRDATVGALFFQIYGPPAIVGVVEKSPGAEASPVSDPRELPIVQDALAAIGKGGYPEAIAFIGAFVGKGMGRISHARLELVDRFIHSDKILSRLPSDEARRIKSEQSVIAELEPERGLESLPKLLADPADRRRALAVLDEAVTAVDFTTEQLAMIDRVRAILGEGTKRSKEEWPDMAARELAATN